MTRQSEIPMRPKGRHYNLTDSEMDCLTWFVLSGCSRDYAYMTFVRPDLAINKRNLSTVSSQFFGSVDVRNYIEAYRSLIRGDVETIDDDLCLDADSRKTKAVSKFTDKVVDKMLGKIDSIEEMDAIAKLADRVGVLEEKEDVEEKPRRYLPVTCSQCMYRSFVESHIEKGNIDNECNHCLTRKYAEEHGWHYDAKKNIE